MDTAPGSIRITEEFARLAVSIGHVFLMVVANIWVRFFANGPLEWLWRSLSYGRRQPFRVRRELPVAILPV